MSEGLCWKCREFLEGAGFDVSKIIPSMFCHHEPEERKPCWCHGILTPQEFMVGSSWRVMFRFCPKCGRKL